MKIINEAKMITIKKYEATDGKVFDTESECLRYENTLNQRINEAKVISSVDCYIPFTNWYIDADESKIYIYSITKMNMISLRIGTHQNGIKIHYIGMNLVHILLQ